MQRAKMLGLFATSSRMARIPLLFSDVLGAGVEGVAPLTCFTSPALIVFSIAILLLLVTVSKAEHGGAQESGGRVGYSLSCGGAFKKQSCYGRRRSPVSGCSIVIALRYCPDITYADFVNEFAMRCAKFLFKFRILWKCCALAQ